MDQTDTTPARDPKLEILLTRAYKQRDRHQATFDKARSILIAGRNDACPCGSGRKAKKCCQTPAFVTQVGATAQNIRDIDRVLASSEHLV